MATINRTTGRKSLTITQTEQKAEPQQHMPPIYVDSDRMWADDMRSSSAAVSPLKEIQHLLEHPPTNIAVKAETMDELFNGKYLLSHMYWIDQGFYLNGFLANFEWWASLARWLGIRAGRENRSDIGGGSDFEFSMQKKIDSLLSLYGAAWHAPQLVDGVGSDPTGIELLKRRKLFRDEVVEFAKNWKDINQEKLASLV